MLKNHLLIAARIIRKNAFYSLINILGLAVGMTALFVIASYVRFERSYDTSAPDNSYRVVQQVLDTGEKSAGLVPVYAPALQENIPGVTNTLRVFSQGGTIQVPSSLPPQAYRANFFVYADSSFFSFFPWEMQKSGHPLPGPYTVALSSAVAKQYFGDADPLGKTIRVVDMFGDQEYTVSAVYDIPPTTHLPAPIVLNNTRLFHPDNAGNHIEGWGAFTTFVQLQTKEQAQALEAASADMINLFKGEDMGLSLVLEPIPSVYLAGKESPIHIGIQGNPQVVRLLGAIGLVVLILAWINYTNLATARALERAREVGVRKTLGSARTQLIGQFLMEAALLNLSAAVLALTFVQILAPMLQTFTGNAFIPSVSVEPLVYLQWLGGVACLGTLASGVYPAIILSGFQPAIVLKGLWKGNKQGLGLRRLLVVFQFTTSVILVGITFTIFQQVQYMRKAPLGVNIDRNIIVKAPRLLDSLGKERRVTFKDQLSSLPMVEAITEAGGMPGMGTNYGSRLFLQEDENRDFPTPVQVSDVDHTYFEHFELPLLAGVGYLPKQQRDYSQVVINASAAAGLGYSAPTEAIGQKIYTNYSADLVEIIGVVGDYHHESLHSPIGGMVFPYQPNAGRYAIKISDAFYTPGQMNEVITTLKEEYLTAFPGNPFEYTFLDDRFSQLYEKDQELGVFTMLFSSLALLIACLGLLGLASYLATQRTKEVGIRKVLGASGGQIFGLLSKEFLRWVGLSTLLAIPLLYWINRLWLAEFPLQPKFSILPYLAPGAIVILFAWGTVSYQTWKVARANPSRALRSE